MIKEPESRFVDYISHMGDVPYRFVVEHDGKEHKCRTLVYASYLAEKLDANIWSIEQCRFIDPYIGRCRYCKKHKELHLVDGNRGSLPPEDDTFGCDECGSVYRIIDILMETGAYKNKC